MTTGPDAAAADASPVRVSQRGLIQLSSAARAIPLDVLHISSLQAGAYVSHFKGRGMEFDESRPYQPGDDPRNIDWRVTARSTQAYTKLFREERERPVLVMVDLRSNMHFATRGSFKSVAAARAAALVAWAAHHRGDRLGGIVFGDTAHRELKPRLGRRAALRYLHELTDHPDWATTETADDTDLSEPFAQAMAALRRVTRPGSLVTIVSDFLSFSRMTQSYLVGLAKHNEVLAIFVSDPLERRLPPPGRYRLVSHDDEMMIDTFAKNARADYRHEFEARREQMDRFAKRYGIHLLDLSTEEDTVLAMQRALGHRSH